jgi:hypothetical protein
MMIVDHWKRENHAIRETSGVPGTHEDTAFCHLQDPGSTNKKIITSSTPRESAKGACTDQGVLDRQNILIGEWINRMIASGVPSGKLT